MADGMAPPSPTRPLHVLQIGMEWFTPGAPGGLARYYTDLFKSMPAAGINLTGVVCSPDNVAALSGGRVQSFSPDGASFTARLMGVRRAVGKIVRDERIDAVACHFALYGAPALDRMAGLPLICHFHGPWAAESGREGERRVAVIAKRAVEKLVYHRAARLVVLSKAFAELLIRNYGVSADRVRVVQGSVDVERFAIGESKADARLALGWPTDRPILLTVRRLAARMGLDRLIDAMADIVKSQPDALLCIGGKGAMAQKLREQCTALGLSDHVRFMGFVPDEDLPRCYRAADINILPTDALEGFGLSAAEALAAGTPSMVTPVGGLPEVVADLAPELIFQSGASEHLAEGLKAALRGDIVLPTSEACRTYAAARFDLSLCGRRVADVYREVV